MTKTIDMSRAKSLDQSDLLGKSPASSAGSDVSSSSIMKKLKQKKSPAVASTTGSMSGAIANVAQSAISKMMKK